MQEYHHPLPSQERVQNYQSMAVCTRKDAPCGERVELGSCAGQLRSDLTPTADKATGHSGLLGVV